MIKRADLQSAALLAKIDDRISRINTQSLDISMNELVDMYKNQELDISPDYQRSFRWDREAESRFIESLMLDLPVPPIYFIEEPDGTYSLVDGLQRISSYLHFRGELHAPDLSQPITRGDYLKLSGLELIPDLNGAVWEDLSTALQLRLKRAFVRCEVIKKTSDQEIKFHMFKRLNTGGVLLTDQQIRNAVMRIIDPHAVDFLNALSDNEDFRICTSTLTNKQVQGSFDRELVLRFFALRNWGQEYIHDLSPFLSRYLELVARKELPFSFDEMSFVFKDTFALLGAALGAKVFGQPSKDKRTITKGFSVYHFEAISIGLQKWLSAYRQMGDNSVDLLRRNLTQLKLDSSFISLTTGGGKNSRGQLRARVQMAEMMIGKDL